MKYVFSVVIPLYNKENYILNTIQSVLNQDFEDFEIIVVNDGSNDDSLAKIKPLKDSRLKIISKKNEGVSIARNTGIEQAEGKYIALLDADDYWYPHHLNSIKILIEKFPQAGIFCDAYEIIMQNKTIRKADFSTGLAEQPQIIEDYFQSSLVNPIIWTSAAAFEKTKFHKIGAFDPKLRTAQDLDFFIRAALKFPVAFHPKVGMRYFKDSENNLAKSKYNVDRLYFISKFKKEELANSSLKKYLDINRFALVVRCKIAGDDLWKKIVHDIDENNLTLKQKFLLNLKPRTLRFSKKIHSLLIQNNIYLTAFK